MKNHNFFMNQALELAKIAYSKKEVPVASLFVQNGKVLAKAINTREKDQDPLGHAELKVLKKASEILGTWRLNEGTIYVTLEPCLMCLGALLEARVSHLVYACSDSKDLFSKEKNELYQRSQIQITKGIREKDSSDLLKLFFKNIRSEKRI